MATYKYLRGPTIASSRRDFLSASQLFSKNDSPDKEWPIRILLTGITGHGKSATGNSILGGRDFKSRGGGGSVTKEYHVGFTRIGGQVLKVVDIPGFNDTDEESTYAKNQLVVDALTNAIVEFPSGFDVILLVVSYTTRLTDETRKAIDCFINLLDREAFKRKGILVITGGDAFERDFNSTNFKDYADKLEFKWLLDICNSRGVLFNNVTAGNLFTNQRQLLLSEIENILKQDEEPYVPKLCQPSKWDKSAMQAQKNSIQKESVMNQLAVLNHDIRNLKYGDKNLQSKVMDLQKQLSDKQGEAEALPFKEAVHSLITKLNEQIEIKSQGAANQTPLDFNKEYKAIQEDDNSWWGWIHNGIAKAVQYAGIALSLYKNVF